MTHLNFHLCLLHSKSVILTTTLVCLPDKPPRAHDDVVGRIVGGADTLGLLLVSCLNLRFPRLSEPQFHPLKYGSYYSFLAPKFLWRAWEKMEYE